MKAMGSLPFSMVGSCGRKSPCWARTGWVKTVAAATNSVERTRFRNPSDFMPFPQLVPDQRESKGVRLLIRAEMKVSRGMDFGLWAGTLNPLVRKSNDERAKQGHSIGFLSVARAKAFHVNWIGLGFAG